MQWNIWTEDMRWARMNPVCRKCDAHGWKDVEIAILWANSGFMGAVEYLNRRHSVGYGARNCKTVGEFELQGCGGVFGLKTFNGVGELSMEAGSVIMWANLGFRAVVEYLHWRHAMGWDELAWKPKL